MNWRRFATTLLIAIACVVASAGTLAVTAAGFALSFDAIRAVGKAAYISPGITWMLPVAIDGAMAVAMVTAIVLRWLGRSPWYPWAVVLIGAAVSIACNAAHASIRGGELELPPEAAMAVSAIPAATLALSVHMLIVLAIAVVSGPAPAVDVPDTEPDTAEMPGQAPAPTAPDPEPIDTPDETPDGTVSGVRLPTTDAQLLAGLLRIKRPDMTPAQIGERVGRSERTIRRWQDATDAESANGTTPLEPKRELVTQS